MIKPQKGRSICNLVAGDNPPMMIIAQNPRSAKDKKYFFSPPAPGASSLFTAIVYGVPSWEADHKLWDEGRHNSSIYAILCKGNQEFSPTSTGFPQAKNDKKPSFQSIKNQLTEKPFIKFVTFHSGRASARAGSAGAWEGAPPKKMHNLSGANSMLLMGNGSGWVLNFRF